MAEGSVAFLLKKVSEFMLREGRLLAGVRVEVESIKVELQFMKTFLRVAEEREDTDPQLKLFTEQVSDVVYEVEDVLDDFKFHLRSDHIYGCQPSCRTVSYLFKSLIAKHQIALRLKRSKAKVISISESYRRYSNENNMEPGPRGPPRRPGRDALQLEEANPLGIELQQKKLIQWLLEKKSDRYVVSVVGMGGLGKTTLVRKVYDNKEVKKRFEFCAWIRLSHLFTTQDLLMDLSQQISQGADNDLRRQEIIEFLQLRKYLIVLDNVSDAQVWSDFEGALPNNRRGSRILLTTRQQDVALASSSPEKTFNMSPLPPKESWTLFCRKIFQSDTCPSDLLDVLQEILVKCQGLPLAIVTIAGVLATKDRSEIEQWELVHRSLGTAIGEDYRLKNILSLSYNDLEYDLKYCLMYFSIFPVGGSIECSRLVRLWIAEGFVQGREGMTLEEIAESHLNELIKRSLVQVVETTTVGRVKTCRVHDFLREMIIVKSRKQDFAAIENENIIMRPEKVRRLSTHNVTLSTQEEVLKDSRLRSLLMFWWSDPPPESFVLDLSYRCFRLLNVLDLGGMPLKKFPDEVVSLYLLKYLSLRNTEVNSIPSSIYKLQNLQTLDLKHTLVIELPPETVMLRKLRHLLAYRHDFGSPDEDDTKYGCKVPAQMGCLQSIQKLCFLVANQGNDLLPELGKLNQLRRLGIIKLKREDGKTLCSSIERMRYLRSLSITSVEKREVIDLNDLAAPPLSLRRLYLTGRLEKLPEWIASVRRIVKVVLKWSGLSDDPLASLQHLPSLAHLEFVQAYDGECLFFQAEGFQRLKFLGLNKLNKLNKIEIEKGAMCNLEKLVVQSCQALQKVPLGIEHLIKLQVLEFCNMPLDIIMALHPNVGKVGDYWKIKQVPEVYFSHWTDGKWDIVPLHSIKGKNSHQSGSSIMQRLRMLFPSFPF